MSLSNPRSLIGLAEATEVEEFAYPGNGPVKFLGADIERIAFGVFFEGVVTTNKIKPSGDDGDWGFQPFDNQSYIWIHTGHYPILTQQEWWYGVPAAAATTLRIIVIRRTK